MTTYSLADASLQHETKACTSRRNLLKHRLQPDYLLNPISRSNFLYVLQKMIVVDGSIIVI
jgi:hypothetical protein